MQKHDLIIIGSGPAGLTAAIYASRAALSYVVLESVPVSGGQVLTTSDVENYPGFSKIGGWDLAMKMKEHADSLGAVFVNKEVIVIKDEGDVKKVICQDGTEYETKTIIAAMGAEARKLGVTGENKYRGRGVSYCATCDGSFYKGKTVAVVGGGDTAMEDALYLSRICEKVYLIHRRNTFRAAKRLVDKVKQQENVEFILETTVSEIKGEKNVTAVDIEMISKESRELKVDGVFIAAGVMPRTEVLKGIVDLDKDGYVVADENCATNCKGVFVAGDIRKKMLRQIVTAVSDGANAVTSAVNYLE